MSSFIWARPLSASEEDYIKQDRYGTKINFLGPLAIIGPADHLYIHRLNVKLESHRIYLDGGQYIDEVIGGAPAAGGVKTEVAWSFDSLNYVLKGAENLNIPFCYHNYSLDLVYFQSAFLDVFVKGFSYADHALAKWHKNLSFLSKCFGASYPDPDGKESHEIAMNVRKILMGKL